MTKSKEVVAKVTPPVNIALADRDPDSAAFSAAHSQLAALLNMDCDLPADELVGRAAQAISTARKLDVGAGLALIKAKSLCMHGEFGGYCAAVGIVVTRASELMSIANAIAGASPEDRKKLLNQPKVALLGLSRMDEEVRADFLASGKLDERLTLDEYRSLLSKRDDALRRQEDTIKGLRIDLQRHEATGKRRLDEVTPMTVVQVRSDAAELAMTAQECVHDFQALMARTQALDGEAATRQWTRAVALSMLSALQSVQQAVHAQIAAVVDGFSLDEQVPAGMELQLAVPGPEEAAFIRNAMLPVLARAEHARSDRGHANYVAERERTPARGRPRNAPVRG